MDNNTRYTELLRQFISEYKRENHWLEFKSNHLDYDKMGHYISALSNGACLDKENMGYLFFGVDNETLEVKGTTFDPGKEKAKGNQDLELYLRQFTSPKIDFRFVEFHDTDGHRLVVLVIPPAKGEPTCFQHVPYFRINSSTTDMRPYTEMMREIYLSHVDWTSEVVPECTIAHLDKDAIKVALDGYCERYPHLAEAARSWDTATFLDKSKLTLNGQITRATLLLLGKEEAAAYLGGMRQINWRLRAPGEPPAGEPFGLPFILTTQRVKDRIRNYRIKIFTQEGYLPAEVWKYDTRTILEGLNNAIAHQDYSRGCRIQITEEPECLTIESTGAFYYGEPEEYAEGKKTPKDYRNPFLVAAMVNIKMIDTQGYGIHTMYTRQMERYLPMPDYEKSTMNEVVLTIPGCVIDKDYSRLLMLRKDIDLTTAILLDRVQKHLEISDEAAQMLRKKKLIEGRKPNYFVSKKVAEATNKEEHKVAYIKNKSFNDEYFRNMIVEYIKQFGKATRKEIDLLIRDKLSGVLSEEQKTSKVHNLMTALREANVIETAPGKVWVLVKK